MDTLQFILLTGVAVVGIAWAIDIPTTKWEGFQKPKARTLIQILESLRSDRELTHEAKPQANTYTEAVKRMQEREQAQVRRGRRGRDPRKV